jgi:AraC-like DNA-binding protein
MPERGAYGERLAEVFGVDIAPAFATKVFRKTLIAVTEIIGAPNHKMSAPIPREDAYLVSVSLRDYPDYEYFEDGVAAPRTWMRAWSTQINDLRRSPTFLMTRPFHAITYYLPRAALDAIADDAGAPRIGEFDYQHGATFDDSVVRALTSTLAPAFEHPEQANRLFIDHVTSAVGAHAARVYGGMKVPSSPARGGLAPWQERRAKEMLCASLNGEISLQEIAQECGLSTNYFSRAFRRSTGKAPHQWLVQHRVDVARGLLSDPRLSLVDVALASGFADQSHFTTTFSRTVGVSPGAWRRSILELKSDPPG